MPRSNYSVLAERGDLHLWKEPDRNTPPSRIGHMLMFTLDRERAEKFFADVLGFRTTDRAVGKVAFMVAGDGVTDHHCFGLINGTHNVFQQSSFQVPSIDDIGFGAWRMNKAGYKESFGPGRHALASNLLHYTRDPWSSWWSTTPICTRSPMLGPAATGTNCRMLGGRNGRPSSGARKRTATSSRAERIRRSI